MPFGFRFEVGGKGEGRRAKGKDRSRRSDVRCQKTESRGTTRILARMPMLLLTTFQIAGEQCTEAGVGLAGGTCLPIGLVSPLSSFSHK